MDQASGLQTVRTFRRPIPDNRIACAEPVAKGKHASEGRAVTPGSTSAYNPFSATSAASATKVLTPNPEPPLTW